MIVLSPITKGQQLNVAHVYRRRSLDQPEAGKGNKDKATRLDEID